MIETKKINSNTYAVTIKRCESEHPTKENTFKVILPKDADKQLLRFVRKEYGVM